MGAVFYIGAGWPQWKPLGIPGTHLPLKRGSWLTHNPGQNYLRKFSPSCPLSYGTKLFPKWRLCGKKTPSPDSMLLPQNAQGSGFLLNTQQHCFQGKGEREEPVQLRFLEKCCPSIQFFQQFCPRLQDCWGLRCHMYLEIQLWYSWAAIFFIISNLSCKVTFLSSNQHLIFIPRDHYFYDFRLTIGNFEKSWPRSTVK